MLRVGRREFRLCRDLYGISRKGFPIFIGTLEEGTDRALVGLNGGEIA